MFEFADNWVALSPSRIVDPTLKVHMFVVGGPETLTNEGSIRCDYDPEIKPDKLFMPVPDEWRVNHTWTTYGPNEMTIFRSQSYETILTGINMWWEVIDECLRVKVTQTDYSFSQVAHLLEMKGYPVISKRPREFILHLIKSVVKLNGFKDLSHIEVFPSIRRVEVCLPAAQAFNFFKLNSLEFREVEPGWVAIALREIVA
jgi:hypothetical protein